MKIINILIAYIMFIALSSNQISAETISQAKQKHPNATLLFLSSEPTTGDLNGFSIERLAITDEKIYIKIEEQEDDIIKEPKEIQGDGKSTVILFKDGSALVLSFKDKFIIYRSETKKGAMFIFDDAKNKKKSDD